MNDSFFLVVQFTHYVYTNKKRRKNRIDERKKERKNKKQHSGFVLVMHNYIVFEKEKPDYSN